MVLNRLGIPAAAVEARRTDFGALEDGTRVAAVEMSNARGMSVRVLALGATVQSLFAPDRNGLSADVVLGYASAREYLDRSCFLGATIGRYANRIAGGKFRLDGRTVTLETNNGPNHLHGGSRGFHRVMWHIESVTSGSPAQAVLTYVSPDGEGGYPGTIRVTATYSLSADNELTVDYQATTDRATIVNLTHHSYFNLAGEAADRDVLRHRLTLFATEYTPVDATQIPTGERRAVAGTPFDFRRGATIGERIRAGRDEQIRIGRGYDHNFIIDGAAGRLRPAARLEEPESGRVLELFATAPGVQFYSGNFLDATDVGKSGHVYRQSNGLCLEPQTFPDTPNRPDFPSARLDPGALYRNTMMFRFSCSS